MKHTIVQLFILTMSILTSVFGQKPGSVPGIFGKGSTDARNFHTSISLVADVESVLPGAAFTVGVFMKMDEGWHTYWKNAGEAGLPPQIRWSLPEGFVAGEVQWPLQQKHLESGDMLTYGYEKENMLLVPLTAPRTLLPGSSVMLKAAVNWLECEHVCVPGNGTAALALPVSASTPAKNNTRLFETYRKKVPAPFSSSVGLSLIKSTRDGAVELRLASAGEWKFMVEKDVVPDFYPESLNDVLVGRTKVTADTHETTMRIPLSVYQKVSGPVTFRGVIVYQMESGERQAAEVEVPLSSEFCAGLPIVGETGPTTGLLDQTFVTNQAGGIQQPLYLYVAFAIVGGLLLNIMPCVLPVIALKVFGLVKIAGDQPQKIKRLGWFFSLGILASFVALAVLVIVLQAAGQQVGWGFQFQEPLFVITMSAVVFAFGLNLFGVYEIQLPGAAVAGVSRVLARQEGGGRGYAASFSEGVFATILATPCTAPFLGTALGFAFAQHAWIILLIFTCVALGMALPYLILTTRPAWLKFLPKPGEWMVTAKQFMGFLMMATLIWLLYVLGRQLGMEAVIWTSAFLLVIGIACWLIGRFATLTATRKLFAATWSIAMILVGAGYWIFLESALDVRSVIAGVPAVPQSFSASGGIQWKPFSLATLESDLKQNRTVFIDFTADWCLTCKVNERTVMSDNSVIEKFKTVNAVAVRADWTNRNPDITRLLAKFGRSGVPLYVIFPAGKPNAPIVLPEVITSGMVIEALDRAAAAPSAEATP